MSQSLFGVKDWRKTSFKVDDAVVAQVFDLLIGHAFERLVRLHHRNSMREAFEILRETSLVGALMEPCTQCLGIVGRKLLIFRGFGQFDDSLRSQHAVQMFMEKYLGQSSQRVFKIHRRLRLPWRRTEDRLPLAILNLGCIECHNIFRRLFEAEPSFWTGSLWRWYDA